MSANYLKRFEYSRLPIVCYLLFTLFHIVLELRFALTACSSTGQAFVLISAFIG